MLSMHKQIPLKGCQQLQKYLEITEQPKLELSGNCFSFACPNCPNLRRLWLKLRHRDAKTKDRHSAACRCQMVFFLAAQPVWLSAIYRRKIWSFDSWVLWWCGLWGDAVCLSSPMPDHIEYGVGKNTKCCSHVPSGVSPTYGLFL